MSSSSLHAPGTALITGGAKRLGAAMAIALARAGWNLVIHYRTSQDEAQQLVEQLHALDRQAWAIPADLSDPVACRELVPRAAELAGELHALINNASIFPSSTLLDLTAQDLQDTVQLHAIAPTLLAQALSKRPEARHIVNLLDSKITGPDDEHLAYHLSKRMLSDLTGVMARHFAPRIAVNAIAPGPILPAEGATLAQFAELAQTVPLQRTGQVQDIAQAILFLMSADFITGQTLHVDGGRHMEGNLYG